jgi:hypothetical protein
MPKSSHKGRRCYLQDQADMRRSLLVVKVLDYIYLYLSYNIFTTLILPLDH